ncbi:MAG: hypothetical protein GY909_07205 [Oligoflexia bacterium]|nr:hypothetical protein [Oligoflexia bacterium]
MKFNFIRNYMKGALARKVLVAILFFSSIITLLLTTLQLYLDYKFNLNNLNDNLNEIKVSHLDSLGQNLWHLNDDQIILQLLGILEIPDIEYLKISTPEGDGYQVGKKSDSLNTVNRRYKINYRQGKQDFILGHLEVVATMDNIYRQLRDRFFIILASQAAKTFIVSFFIILIFNNLVAKHLEELVSKIKGINIENLNTEIKLDKLEDSPPDEIDQLLTSFKKLQSNLLHDIKVREEVEQRLKESQKMEALGTLAGGVAHDFNNILQGILNCFMLIETEIGPDHPASSKVAIGNTLCDRGKELVNQVLLYSRKDLNINHVFKLDTLINEVLEILKQSFDQNVHYDIEIPETEKELKGNPTQIRQIVFNLCNNAIHAIQDSEGPTIRVSLEIRNIETGNSYQLTPGEYFYLIISDNGHGIAQDALPRIFEPFFTTKEVGKGTGLGLSVVQGIVINHGGSILVNSVINEGTTFSIFLPTLSNS